MLIGQLWFTSIGCNDQEKIDSCSLLTIPEVGLEIYSRHLFAIITTVTLNMIQRHDGDTGLVHHIMLVLIQSLRGVLWIVYFKKKWLLFVYVLEEYLRYKKSAEPIVSHHGHFRFNPRWRPIYLLHERVLNTSSHVQCMSSTMNVLHNKINARTVIMTL